MFYGFIAGLAGGALGLGGAIILVPVWLNSKVDKNVAVSTSPPLIFLSSFHLLLPVRHLWEVRTIPICLVLRSVFLLVPLREMYLCIY